MYSILWQFHELLTWPILDLISRLVIVTDSRCNIWVRGNHDRSKWWCVFSDYQLRKSCQLLTNVSWFLAFISGTYKFCVLHFKDRWQWNVDGRILLTCLHYGMPGARSGDDFLCVSERNVRKSQSVHSLVNSRRNFTTNQGDRMPCRFKRRVWSSWYDTSVFFWVVWVWAFPEATRPRNAIWIRVFSMSLSYSHNFFFNSPGPKNRN
jgi:hypothetical protein